MGVNHPSLWLFISCLQWVEVRPDCYYKQLKAGNSITGKLKKYINVNKIIFKIVRDYKQL